MNGQSLWKGLGAIKSDKDNIILKQELMNLRKAVFDINFKSLLGTDSGKTPIDFNDRFACVRTT